MIDVIDWSMWKFNKNYVFQTFFKIQSYLISGAFNLIHSNFIHRSNKKITKFLKRPKIRENLKIVYFN